MQQHKTQDLKSLHAAYLSLLTYSSILRSKCNKDPPTDTETDTEKLSSSDADLLINLRYEFVREFSSFSSEYNSSTSKDGNKTSSSSSKLKLKILTNELNILIKTNVTFAKRGRSGWCDTYIKILAKCKILLLSEVEGILAFYTLHCSSRKSMIMGIDALFNDELTYDVSDSDSENDDDDLSHHPPLKTNTKQSSHSSASKPPPPPKTTNKKQTIESEISSLTSQVKALTSQISHTLALQNSTIDTLSSSSYTVSDGITKLSGKTEEHNKGMNWILGRKLIAAVLVVGSFVGTYGIIRIIPKRSRSVYEGVNSGKGVNGGGNGFIGRLKVVLGKNKSDNDGDSASVSENSEIDDVCYGDCINADSQEVGERSYDNLVDVDNADSKRDGEEVEEDNSPVDDYEDAVESERIAVEPDDEEGDEREEVKDDTTAEVDGYERKIEDEDSSESECSSYDEGGYCEDGDDSDDDDDDDDDE